jgi:hypothetical protein
MKSAVLTVCYGIVSITYAACAQGLNAPKDDDAATGGNVMDTGVPGQPDSGVAGCSALRCDDGKECTVDSCDDEDHCQHIPREGTCTDDASSCTDDVCNSGMCTHPSNGSCPCDKAEDCNDNNPCTDDSCSPERKCVNAANRLACEDDGKECTNDVCSEKSCLHPPRSGSCTDEGSVCTDDVCDGTGECTHPRNATCQCIDASECMDNEPCTDDSCDSDHKCQHTEGTGPCASDNDSCTCDVCSAGECTHQTGMSCGATSAIVIDSFDSSADWDTNLTTPLHLAFTGKTSFDNTNLEGNSVLYLAESGTGTLEFNVASLSGLTKISVEMTGYGTGTASMIELGVFDSSTSMWKDRALSLYGSLPDGVTTTLEVPIADYMVSACKITKVRLDFNVTGGQKFWRFSGITAE